MKTYILQKDLPDAKAGDQFTNNKTEGWYYRSGNVSETIVRYPVNIVESNAEWFKQSCLPRTAEEFLDARRPSLEDIGIGKKTVLMCMKEYGKSIAEKVREECAQVGYDTDNCSKTQKYILEIDVDKFII